MDFSSCCSCYVFIPGVGVLPYIIHKGICAAPKGRVLELFWSEFAHFGVESGMVFEGTTGVYERIWGES